jgi:hypothetical protein
MGSGPGGSITSRCLSPWSFAVLWSGRLIPDPTGANHCTVLQFWSRCILTRIAPGKHPAQGSNQVMHIRQPYHQAAFGMCSAATPGALKIHFLWHWHFCCRETRGKNSSGLCRTPLSPEHGAHWLDGGQRARRIPKQPRNDRASAIRT